MAGPPQCRAPLQDSWVFRRSEPDIRYSIAGTSWPTNLLKPWATYRTGGSHLVGRATGLATSREETRMSLPVRTALADIDAICGYLISKPEGASAAELINEKALDRRKLSALKFWGLIEDAGAKLRLSERGLLAARDKGANRATALREVVAAIAPYGSIVTRAVHLKREYHPVDRSRRALAPALQGRGPFRHSQSPDGLLLQDCGRRRPRTAGRRSQGAADAV